MSNQVLLTSVKVDPTPRIPVPAFAGLIVGQLRRFWAKKRDRRILSELSERQLRDIGLPHEQIVRLKEPSFAETRDLLARSTCSMKML